MYSECYLLRVFYQYDLLFVLSLTQGCGLNLPWRGGKMLCLHDRVSRHARILTTCLYFDVTDDVFPVGVSVGMSFSKWLN